MKGNLRHRALVITLLFVVVAIAGGVVLRRYEPDYYKPARVALVSARQQLEAAYSHEHALLEQLQIAHEELQRAIDALPQAVTDTADRQQVEDLRQRLLDLQDGKQIMNMTPESLKQSYQAIERELNALINKIETENR